jgi:hypothetical protein
VGEAARTFRAGGVLLGMTNPSKIGKKLILDQQLRITRRRELIARLERDGHPQTLADARGLLAETEQTLAKMQADISQKGLADPT